MWRVLVGGVGCGGVCSRVGCVVGYWVVVLFVWRLWALVFVVGCRVLAMVGGRGCLGAGCVVRGGVLPEWLGGVVAGGGAGVSFDVGARVFVLSGVGVPAPVSGSASSPVSGVVEPAPVSGGGCVSSCGGVAVCVPCALAAFGDSWCSLVLRRWARAAGVDGAKVDALLGSAPGSDSGPVVPGSVLSSRGGVVSPVSGGSVSLRSPVGGGRVGAGFGARVRDWGACVGVGGGVVSGGGVVAGWWQRAVGRVRGLVSGVGAKGLVLAGLVGVVVLVSVLVLVG